ncbi:MAG: cyclic nucleotide-binding domain-containing protein [Myxococcales bacterium]|nr:cyclic nucleotide-binding domain-containing protein [Myxococcales bacterium]
MTNDPASRSMTDAPETEALDDFPMMRRLPREDRERLAVHFGERRSFRAGDEICRMGEPPGGLYAVVSGEVSLTRDVDPRGRQRELGPGAMFGLSSLLSEGGHRLRVSAVRPTVLRLLPHGRYAEAVRAVPAFAAFVEECVRLHALEHAALEAMRRSKVLCKITPHHHRALLEVARLVRVPAGDTVVKRGSDAEALFLVAEGKLQCLVDQDGDGRPDVVRRLQGGDCFGEPELFTGRPHSATVVARTDATLIAIDRAEILDLLGRSSGFAQALRSITLEGQPIFAALGGQQQAEVVLFLSDGAGRFAEAIDLLAGTIGADFQERAAVVHLYRGDTPPPGPQRSSWLRAPFTAPELAAAVGSGGTGSDGETAPPDYLFLDATHLQGDLGPLVAKAKKVVLFTTDPSEERLPPGVPASKVLFAALVDELVQQAGHRDGLPARTVRLRLDRARVARSRGRLADLRELERATFGRFGRAVTERRVGVALGGGGAFGFAHVALLRGLAKDVPIDMVSGSSFGAVAGAYYSTLGDAGLTKMEERSTWLSVVVGLGVVHSGFIAALIDRDLGAQRIERLETALFAATTDVGTGALRALSCGPVGLAVRASGSFPGALTPTLVGGRRLVDGGIANNVPDNVLITEGAQLVVAANVVPPPAPEAPRTPYFRGAVGRWAHEFNPALRMRDTVRSFFIMMHSAGAAEAESSDVVYNAGPSDFQAWSFRRSGEIIGKAEVAVQPAVEKAVARWRQIARPRERTSREGAET